MAACLHLPRGLRWTQVPRDGRGACFLAAAPGASTRELSLFVFFFLSGPECPSWGRAGSSWNPRVGRESGTKLGHVPARQEVVYSEYK